MTTVVGNATAGRESTPDAVVPYPDQALFLALRGAGQAAVMQALWIYEEPVDLAGLRSFHRRLHRGLLGRRVEPSPLPFGRLRWVAGPVLEDNFHVGDLPRPRSELFEWADEQVDLPLDPQWGPAWRLGVQPFTDGSTVVGLVVSHCIADGTGCVLALLEAIYGSERALGYPPPGARPTARAIAQDLGQFASDLPDTLRALRHAGRIGVSRRRELARPQAPVLPAGEGPRTAHVPCSSALVEISAWQQRAESLGGNSFSLAIGFAAKLAENLNRIRSSDGLVTVMIPVNERKDLDNTGGNVVSIAHVEIAPGQVTDDLTAARSAVREGLRQTREQPDEVRDLLPLIPFVPKRGIARVADAAFGFSTDLPVTCSNLGDLPADILRVDGTPAAIGIFRGVDRKVSRDALERRGGLLTVAAGRIGDEMVLTVISYQPGATNAADELRAVVTSTLGEFGLTGRIL
jgi:hypothetical protein